MHMRIDAMKVAAGFAKYTSSKWGFNGNHGNPSGSATARGGSRIFRRGGGGGGGA